MPNLLKAKRMSQAEFARKIDVSEAFVTQVIKLEAYFSIQTGRKAAKLFGCKIDDLYAWHDEDED